MEPHRPVSPTEPARRRLNRVSGAFRRLGRSALERCGVSKNQVLAFVPGMMFLAMGFALLFAPNLFVALLSGLLLYLGLVLLYVGLKILHLHDRFRDVVKQVETRIYIRGDEVQNGSRAEGGSKKILFH